MERDSEEKRLIRRYLFGEITEAERRGIEKKMINDDDFFNMVISQEEELVEQYTEHQMPVEDREKFERSYLSTPEGKDQVLIARELLKYNSTDRTSRRTTDIGKMSAWPIILQSPYVRIAVSILIFIGLSFGVYRALIYKSDAAKGLAELKQIYKDGRPTEARLTGFDHAPWSVSRSDDDKDESEKAGIAHAERLLSDAVYYSPGAESYHALGVFYLTERQFDKAITQFEMAASYNLPNSDLHHDWGTALLERGRSASGGKSERVVEDFSESLVHLQKALELNPSRLDAHFNLALLFEAQGMLERAKEEWEEYLKKESDSKWANEARENLRRLEENRRISLFAKQELLTEFTEAYKSGIAEQAWRLLSRSREPLSGKSISEQLLDAYIDKSLTGETAEGQYALNLLSFAGELEFQRTKERYSQTLANFYKGRSLADLQILKQARNRTKQGHGYYVEDQYDRAIEEYTEARNIFYRLGDKAEAAAGDYWIAYCYTDMFDAKAGIPLLKTLMRYCDVNQFRWLFARAVASMAANYYVQNKHSEAAKHYRSSLEIAEEIEDPISALNSLDSLTELYRSIGNYPKSFDCIQRGFTYTLTSPLNPIQRLRHYSIVASALASAGLFEAALEYQKEGLNGDVSTAPINATVAYAHLGALYAKQKKYDEANKSIELAYETAKLVSTEKLRDNLMAYSSLYLGHIYRGFQDYDKAIATYTDTIETLSNLEIPVILYQAHKGRLYCYLAKNDDTLIQEELDTTLKILESDRSSILEADDRNNFFDKEQNVYDIAIEYAGIRLGDDHKAFEYSEASRARSLLDMMKSVTIPADDQLSRGISFREAFSPLTFKGVEDQLPEPAQVVQYAVLDGKTVVWVISKTNFSSEIIDVDREKLDTTVKNYLNLISRLPSDNSEDWRPLSGELFDILIRPIIKLLDDKKSIYIVPDKILSYLPFESLISTVTGNYLLEDYDIAYAPSSSVFIACSEEAQKRGVPSTWHILSVGNPTFDRQAFPGLKDLSSAAREADTVAGFYDTRTLLTKNNAREQRVRSEMEKADMIHIAAHAVPGEYSSLQSKLILARKDHSDSNLSEDGILEAEEMYKIAMPRTRLAVLSACDSGVDRYYKGEGMMSLARPFTAAGVPLVVATFWKVDSDSTADLMVDFHITRRRGNTTSIKALKEAKVKMAKQGPERYRHPYYWAAFVAIGGYADY